jgi:hypothetical protein
VNTNPKRLTLFVLLVIEQTRTSPGSCVQADFWKPHELGRFHGLIFAHFDVYLMNLTNLYLSKEGAKREISPTLKEVTFTGGLKISKDIGLYRDVDPTKPIYVGLPSPEIDAAWAELVQRRSKLSNGSTAII